MQTIEKHQWQFRDQRIPARIFHLAVQEEITFKDFLLLSIIDAMVKPQMTEPGSGCWASNSYLGKGINAHERSVSKRIAFLKKKGLVLIVNLNGQRYLELEWSRTAEERENLEGEYGVLLRSEYKHNLKRIKTKGTPRGVVEGTPRGVPNNNDNYERYEKRRGSAITHPPSPRRVNSFSEGTSHERIIPNDKHSQNSNRLRQILRKHNKQVLGSSLKKWYDPFRLLEEKDKQNYQSIFDWFVSCLDQNKGDVSELNLPSIGNAHQFRHHFQWISDVMKRTHKSLGYTNGQTPKRTEAEHKQNAELLFKKLERKSKYDFIYNQSPGPGPAKKSRKWIEALLQMEKDGIDYEKVLKVLVRFIGCEHTHERYFPVITSTMEFREKWPEIYKAYQRVVKEFKNGVHGERLDVHDTEISLPHERG